MPGVSSTIDVGTASVGETISKQLIVKETGTDTLDVGVPGGGVLSGPHAGDFSLINGPPFSIADGGADEVVTIRCTPSGEGVRTATLSFTTNDPSQPDVSYTLTCTGVIFYVYLPGLLKNYVTGSDLVVESVTVDSSGVLVIIKNISPNASVRSEFQVDLYVDPSPVPTGVNQPWSQLSSEGIVWIVNQPIQAGGQLALILNDPFFVAGLSNYSGAPPAGTPIYVQVDSVNSESSFGNVLEIHEIEGGVYNNIIDTVAGP